MATKAEVKALQDEVTLLNRNITQLNSSIAEKDMWIKAIEQENEDLRSLNKHLSFERDRLNRAESIARQQVSDMAVAVAILGHREQERFINEIWHECMPHETVNQQAIVSDDSQKL